MRLAPPSRLSVSAIATLTSKCPDGLCNLARDAIASSPRLNPRLAAWFGGEVGPIAELEWKLQLRIDQSVKTMRALSDHRCIAVSQTQACACRRWQRRHGWGCPAAPLNFKPRRTFSLGACNILTSKQQAETLI